MDDLISRQAAIDAAIEAADDWDGGCNIGRQKRIEKYIRQLPPSQPEILYIISETLHECGVYGEEATIKLIGTLKRLRMDDLIPPCAR